MTAGKVIGSFGTFEAPERVNPYIDTFAEFAKVAEKHPDASWVVELDAKRETSERILISEAANKVGKTARLRNRDDSKRTVVGNKEKSGNPIYDGKVTLTFTLSEKHKSRKPKDQAENATQDAAE